MLTTYKPHHAIIDSADLQPSTKIKYRLAIDALIQAGIDPRNTHALAQYAASLPHSGRAFLKSALRLLYADTATLLKANATADNLSQTQASLLNLEAMNNSIRVHTPKGKKASVWLSPQQIEEITSLPDNSLQGKRDWIILGVLLGAGLRRSELASLTFDQIKKQPDKSGQMRAILDITGKGKKKRIIPISPTLEKRLNEWKEITGGGFVARSINKAGVLNDSLSDKSINEIVHKYGALIERPELEAHDCRRSWAQMGLNAGIPITQISVLLGHSTVAVTQKYLDLEINLENTISDYIPLKG